MKCVIYRRVSSDEQTKGYGLDRQLELAELLANEQDLSIQQIYTDKGKSASKGEHTAKGGQLRQLYDDIESGVIHSGTILITEDLDRLSRQIASIAMGELTTNLINKGIEVWTFLDGLQKYTQTATFTLMLALVKQETAYIESAKKKERGLASHANKRAMLQNGEAPKIRRPFWIDLVKDEYVLNEQGALVKTIFELSLQGNGRINIAKQLNEQGIKPIGWKHDSKRKNEWDSNKVSNILRSVSVMGDWHSPKHDQTFKDVFPQVISRNDFHKVQSLARKNPRKLSKHKISIFQGLLDCPYCGAVYSRRSVVKTDKTYYSYKCSNSQQCAASKQVSESVLDVFVLKYLGDLDWSFMDKDDNTELNAELLELQHERKILNESIKKRSSSAKLDRLDDVEIRIEAIQSQLDRASVSVDTEFDHERIINGDEQTRVRAQQALKLLIERIQVYSVGVLPNELADTLPDKFKLMRKHGAKQAHVLIHFNSGEIRQVGLCSDYVASNRGLLVE
ncbi:recombinase-related protein [Vibrio sp. N418]|uniref:recombinase family protein n=1 Tax=Vibrio sp. (strain N418) TaxID=701176 RepID=UPI00021C0773|nr:recombinase family protein [Vibrio sp. N418]EGU31491.1 recombinase-related protein [Vibrio sp. N418]